ncbi:dihydrolipoyl dehydrogenase [Sphingomicrobium astaxanthinifaciens]|uniref:dihydrolipoyl dehydrogenase n=1 Tax=Sphingomicrobium astaxanthinifaciens TaxID=1227949 RepID=UPI001FCA641F|nr:dihydrolipoyl dehydrogenase [Sphingomicrobium astaxanthinifaciens]MCJ7421703.1 dihydrolipoyl dehydrogenase [Sphingomicrobium astaxanthinifaciens]
MSNAYDLIVLGSGPGGYVAAIRASQLGLKTAIVEREKLGGICLNWGCIPTKALLRSGEIFHHMKHAESFGLKAEGVSMDLDKVVARSRAVAKQLNQGVTGLMKKNKIDVHMGNGSIDAPGKLTVEKDGKTTQLTAKHIIVATGARARDLPFAPADGDKIWTYRTAMTPPAMPQDLLVIGSGAIGIEFASFYNDMGANVTVVEMLDRIVPVEDADISAELHKQLKKQGMTIMPKAGVQSLKADKNGVTAEIKDDKGKVEKKQFSHCIVAIGIVPNTEKIGLEKLKVKTTKGHIDTDEMCRTNVKGIWAIGDVTAPPWLAHKASHEGIIAVEAIVREMGNKEVHPHAMDVRNIPGCTYCHPQVASVGLTEAKAKEAGHKVKVGKFPFIGNGKAIALGETQGFIKTVFDAETGELLGAHMIGAEVTELIQGYTIGKTAELVETDFINTVFAHPTLSEMMHEAVLSAEGRVLHI